MSKQILWCLTGSGSYLREIFNLFVDLKHKFSNLKIGIALSRAGVEVARLYGILNMLDKIASGGRYDGIYYEHGYSGITKDGIALSGRVSLRRYDLIVVAPATSNTVAKIVHGIADSLPTIIINQALKTRIPVIIFPSDYDVRSKTHLPCIIDESKCTLCYICISECPHKAIYKDKETAYPRINYNKCRGCEICVKVCKYEAISCWTEIEYTPSKIDLKNLDMLKNIDYVIVTKNITDLQLEIMKFIKL